jgi:hypothetical protein
MYDSWGLVAVPGEEVGRWRGVDFSFSSISAVSVLEEYCWEGLFRWWLSVGSVLRVFFVVLATPGSVELGCCSFFKVGCSRVGPEKMTSGAL